MNWVRPQGGCDKQRLDTELKQWAVDTRCRAPTSSPVILGNLFSQLSYDNVSLNRTHYKNCTKKNTNYKNGVNIYFRFIVSFISFRLATKETKPTSPSRDIKWLWRHANKPTLDHRGRLGIV